jgi:hypothetical protein
MQLYRVLAILAVYLFCRGGVAAQVIELRTVGDKTVTRMHSGLSSDRKDCGLRYGWHDLVFVGSISGITPIADDELKLEIIPEEIFHGQPATPQIVLTTQAACLPKMQVGDRWLFYLRVEKNKPVVLDYFANDSRPVADAREQIETLHRLETIGESAIVRGRVFDGPAFNAKTVPGACVTARSESEDIQFVSLANGDGRFEFEPLPAGKYRITAEGAGSVLTDVSRVHVSAGDCLDLTLSRLFHARIGGYVRRVDGSPVANVDLIVISADNSWYATSGSDARGHFEFGSLRSGEYVVGMKLPGTPAWEYSTEGKPPAASLYYGGSTTRSGAVVIKVGADEKMDDLEFIAAP